MSKTSCSPIEMMIIAASRLLEDGKTVVTGTGTPILAAQLAMKMHAPNLAIIYEAGGMCPSRAYNIPISVGDSMTTHKAVMTASMDYIMSFLQAGYAEYGMLGAAQIDAHGNINTTVIGPHDKPKVRLPGSGGANDFGSLCWKTIIIMGQDKRKFVKKLDYLTTPGFLEGTGAREKAGLPVNSGPWRVVTPLGVYGFDDRKEMYLVALNPNFTIKDIEENSSCPIHFPNGWEVNPRATDSELKTLRALDPYRIVLGK